MKDHAGERALAYADATDVELVHATLDGDRDAFGALIERYAAAARRMARSVTSDPDEADDAAQDGFLNALRKLAQYDQRRPFGPWLLRIVANAATDRGRRRAVRKTEPLHERFATHEASPSDETDRRMLVEQLRAALMTLPDRRRLAVVLFDVEGYSHREIAEILDVKEGTIRSDVFHARRHLRTVLAHWKEADV